MSLRKCGKNYKGGKNKMAKYKVWSAKEKAKQLKSTIEDFKKIGGFSERVQKKYEDQLKEVEKEIESDKQKMQERKSK